MNKEDLVTTVAKVVGSKKIAEKAISCMLATITKGMKKGEAVTLVGFGTFSVGKRKARMGRNPQTGAGIRISAKKVPKFTPGKALKGTVSGYKSPLGQPSAIFPIVYKCTRCNYRRRLRLVPSEPLRCPKHGTVMRREN